MQIRLLALLLFLPLLGISQYTIKGKVTLEGNPKAGINVQLSSELSSIFTNSEGDFEFTDLVNKPYTLTFSYPGALTVQKEVPANSTALLEVDLQLDLQLFEEIKITNDYLGLTERTPYTILQLPLNDITYKGSPSGIMGMIQNEPGINSADMGHGISKPFMRGLGFSRVVTLYQGNKLENHQWGADHGLGLNDLGVASAQIIKGPASILYGSGAIGGVIVLNDDESYLDSTKITGNFGTTVNTVSAGLRTYGSLGKKFKNGFFIAGDLAAENHADYKDGNNRIVGNSRFNSQTIRLHLGIQKEHFRNKLSYTYNNQLLGIIDDNEMIDSLSLATFHNDRAMQLPYQRVTDHLISYQQEMKHSDQLTSEVSLSYHFNDRNEIEENVNEIDLGLTQAHTFYTARFNYRKEKWKHSLGLQGSIVDMKNKEEAKEILIPNAFSIENGLYYLGTWRKNKHTLQGGIRYDVRYTEGNSNQANIIEQGYQLPEDPADRKLGRLFTGFTGSLGYTYEFNKGSRIKSNLSSGYRAPDIAELFANGNHPGTNRFEVGNVNFSREQNLQMDLSWGQEAKRFNYEISLFGNVITNYIFFSDSGDTTNTGLNIWSFNQTDAVLFGGEFHTEYIPLSNERLSLSLSGSLIRGTQTETRENLTFIPADRLIFRVNYQPISNSPLFIHSSFQQIFTQNRPGFNEQTTNGYQLWNAGLKYDFTLRKNTLAVAITGFNLLNLTYVDHLSVLRAFSIPSPGRNLMLNLQWRF